MIKNYLVERRSWIILFIGLQLLSLFIAYIDPAITMKPILYTVFLSTVILILFLIIRYQKETNFYKQLREWDSNYDLASLREAQTPFEKIIEAQMIQQTEKFKHDITADKTALTREMDEFISWVHEVKTPLAAMQLIIDRVEDNKVKQQLTYEWSRIHFLLDQQLHQKRIPAMENDLYMEKVALGPLIFKEIKAVKSWCINKGIGIDVSLDAEDVLTDAKWLAFIIRQLLTNAVKYTDRDDIVISSYRLKEQTILTMEDHGRGIAEKDMPRIFDRGFTSTTAHRDTASTGMGLYLIKNVAKTLHIQIDVQSEVNKGTTVTLTFPGKNDFVSITGM